MTASLTIPKLTPPQIHALACIAKDADDVRDSLAVRDYSLDFGIQIKGVLRVSATQNCNFSSKPGFDLLLAAVLQTLGPKKRILVAEAIDAAAIVKVDDATLALVTQIQNRLKTKSPGTRRGSVAGTFDVAVID